MSREQIIARLIDEMGYPAFHAPTVADKIAALDPRIRAAFDAWWTDGTMPADLRVEGFTVEGLVASHNLKMVAAFLTLDWLLREPDKAKATLKKGFDRIS